MDVELLYGWMEFFASSDRFLNFCHGASAYFFWPTLNAFVQVSWVCLFFGAIEILTVEKTRTRLCWKSLNLHNSFQCIFLWYQGHQAPTNPQGRTGGLGGGGYTLQDLDRAPSLRLATWQQMGMRAIFRENWWMLNPSCTHRICPTNWNFDANLMQVGCTPQLVLTHVFP